MGAGSRRWQRGAAGVGVSTAEPARLAPGVLVAGSSALRFNHTMGQMEELMKKLAFVWLRGAENAKSPVCVVEICKENAALGGLRRVRRVRFGGALEKPQVKGSFIERSVFACIQLPRLAPLYGPSRRLPNHTNGTFFKNGPSQPHKREFLRGCVAQTCR